MKLLDDVRALGFGAPLRAGYELSKRTIGHDIVFDRLVSRGHAPSSSRRLSAPTSVSEQIAEGTRLYADQVCAGRVEVFSTWFDLGAEPNWHAVLDGDGQWPLLPWWKIDIRSEQRIGDVKWVWELGRFRHVVVLARACWLDPSNDSYANALRQQVTSFLDQNPAERGVHWYSNLELSLRAYAFAQILSLAEGALGPPLCERVVDTLYRTGRHLLADLPYTVSTMRNNHLLGDAIGLCTVGFTFADDSFGRRCSTMGDRLIRRFLKTAQRDNGTFIEDSISYHRFVVELLSARLTLGPASQEVGVSLRRAAEFMARLGVLDGDVPQYGDWDEGRVLMTAGDPKDLAGSARAGLCLGSGIRDEPWASQYDEVAWYCLGTPGSIVSPPAVIDGSDVGGGVARAKSGNTLAYIKAPAGHSHNHADATAVSLHTPDGWLIGDPGTGTYNGDESIRNYFRASVAHNVLRIDGLDQLEPHRAFRWKHRANGGTVDPIPFAGGVVMAAWHDAYQRLEIPTTVLRVLISCDNSSIVADFVSAPAPGQLAVTFGPDVVFEGDVVRLGGQMFRFDLAHRYDSVDDATPGSWSSTYGSTQPTTRVEVDTPAISPITWSLSTRPIAYTTDDQTLLFEHGRMSVAWHASSADLIVEFNDGHRVVRTVSW